MMRNKRTKQKPAAGASRFPKPSFVHEQAGEKTIQFKMRTGQDPKAVYMGRKEMTMLIMWAVSVGIFEEDTKVQDVDLEGDNRPEVSELPVYLVNVDSYLEVG